MRLPSPLYLVSGVTLDAPMAMAIIERLVEVYRLVPRRNQTYGWQDVHRRPCEEGLITSRDIIAAAAEFDEISGESRYTASDFAAWMVAEVKGTPEERWLMQRRLS